MYLTIDDRKTLAIEYITGWFIIDLLSIVPFDLIVALVSSQDASGQGKVKGIVRITKISKLYKLVKITRLLRLLKIIKDRKKILGDFKKVV